MWKRDSRIFHSHGIHLKFAHTASAQDFTDVRNAIIKDPHCLGTGDFGFAYFTHFSSYKTQQITLCRKFLQLLVKEELFSKVMVIHCRDKKGSTEASETCLKVFGEELPTFDRDVLKIHHHCFNGRITQLRNWLACFPRMILGSLPSCCVRTVTLNWRRSYSTWSWTRSSWKWMRLILQPLFTVSAIITPLMVWKRWLVGWRN